MEIRINPPRSEWSQLSERNIPDDPAIDAAVSAIISRVAQDGDEALRRMALEFDRAEISDLEVSEAEFEAAEAAVSPEVKDAIDVAISNITDFHRAQLPSEIRVETMPGVSCVQRPVPIGRVGDRKSVV